MTANIGLGKNVLITGASRGIGLTFIQHLVKIPSLKNIFAACRNPENASKLQNLQKSHSTLHIIKLDVQDDDSIKSAFNQIQQILNGEPLNLLINNAGIFELDGVTMENPNRKTFLRHFDVNTVSYTIISSTFLPLLLKAAEAEQRALVVNISSYMASIEIGKLPPSELGCNVVYGMSKAAQNSFTRVFGKKYSEKGLIVIAINPGGVNTEMNPTGNVSADDSVANMLETVSKLTKNESVTFIDRFGKALPF